MQHNIILQSLHIEGFKSFVHTTSVDFSDTGGLKFLGGVNEVEPRLGANGAGKSSLWDALNWCNYGSTIRGNSTSEVTSWGVKRPRVAALYLIEGKEVVVERLGNPNRLTINDVPSTQEEVNGLLRLSKGRFAHSVLFGQMVPMFLDLAVPARGVLLDEVLDLGIWNKASDVATARCRDMTATIAQLNKDVGFQQGIREANKHNPETAAKEATWSEQYDANLEAWCTKLETAEAKLAELMESVTATTAAVVAANAELLKFPVPEPAPTASYQATIRKNMLRRGAIGSDKARADKEITFYEINDVCPTCHQSISDELSNHKHDELCAIVQTVDGEVAELDKADAAARDAIAALESKHASAVAKRLDIMDKVRTARQANADAETKYDNAQKYTDELAETVSKLVEAPKVNPYTEQLAASALAFRNAGKAAMALQAQAEAAEGKLLRLEYWKAGFRSVRLFIVRRILQQLELEVANAASLLGLTDWKIQFVTETENKSGGIKAGVQVLVSSPHATGTWEVWSGGEGQRLRIAVAIGLASLIQRMAGANYSLEIWDEPSAWLSPEGIEDLMDCLAYRAQTTGKSVWICDHRALNYPGFAEIMMVRKSKDGSSVSMLKQAIGTV